MKNRIWGRKRQTIKKKKRSWRNGCIKNKNNKEKKWEKRKEKKRKEWREVEWEK